MTTESYPKSEEILSTAEFIIVDDHRDPGTLKSFQSHSNSCFNTPINKNSCVKIGIPCITSGLQIEISSGHEITCRLACPVRSRTVGGCCESWATFINGKISEGMQKRKTHLTSMSSNDVLQKLVFYFGLHSNIKRPVPEQRPFMFFCSRKRFAELHTIFRLSSGVA